MSRVVSAGEMHSDGSEARADGYLEKSSRPLASLTFLLPLVIVYEVGTRFFTTAALRGQDQQIVAFSKMQEFFGLFGASGRHVPALAVVVIMLAWHIARNDAWRVEIGTLAVMALECVVLSLPLFLLSFLLARYFPLAGVAASDHAGTDPARDMLIMSIGAGIYEEFVFRFVLFTLFSLLLHDLLKLHRAGASLLMVVASGLLFSAYHYWDTGEQFALRIFAFRTLAGLYFGLVFLLRGFGITAGSHSFYDLIFTLVSSF